MAEVVNDLLGYEGLKIIQDTEKFNFSLDSTLLADFVTINPQDKTILDIGSGNGFIPLFLTLKTNALIEGIEIQKELAEQSIRSVQLNNLSNQIIITNDDVRGYYKKVGVSKYDVITCNPPFFIYKETSNTNKNDYLTIARHEVTLNLDELLDSVKKLLKDNGTFAMVHRTERLLDILEAFRKYGIEPKRIKFVYPKKTSTESLLVLVEGKKSYKKGGLKILKPLYVHNLNGDYTKEVLKIFNYQPKR
ncbi:MAG: tRNA1(Val) (adenine(37)-N6)-methyltransferase [Bacilli bacterium]|nr:tRNA1(Val) (adenine(37)-N6)-methyltransferase [Bacilli bacterium]